MADVTPREFPRAVVLVNGAARAGGRGWAGQRHRKAESSNEEDLQAMRQEADPATLKILNAVREVDNLPSDRAALKLRLLRDCYPLLEQVPAHRFDSLAVLVYQKEGDVYLAQGDAENAKTTYSRAIRIAETRVASGEKEIYMVLKRYVRAMVGMARLWYVQERDTVGFTLAKKTLHFVDPTDERERSLLSSASSLLSDCSVFSLNQEILNSMAPKPPRRRAGPTVKVVRLLQPTARKQEFTDEDNFVLRSQMPRELKTSPCELLLLRCIEVVEIGHRRQSELLIPALIELAQIYEDLHLFNRSLLLVRRCLGILSVVYDYDHPWIIQLRHRGDYLVERMEEKMRGEMATKIKATWKMHRAMQQLEETLGRPVRRHVWVPGQQPEKLAGSQFLKEFVSGLPDGTVLSGVDKWDAHFDTLVEEEKEVFGNQHGVSNGPLSLPGTLSESPHEQSLNVKADSLRRSMRRSTRAMDASDAPVTISERALRTLSLSSPKLVVPHGNQLTVNTANFTDERVVVTQQDGELAVHTAQSAREDLVPIGTTTTTWTVVRKTADGKEEEYVYEEKKEYVGENGVKVGTYLDAFNEELDESKLLKEGAEQFSKQ